MSQMQITLSSVTAMGVTTQSPQAASTAVRDEAKGIDLGVIKLNFDILQVSPNPSSSSSSDKFFEQKSMSSKSSTGTLENNQFTNPVALPTKKEELTIGSPNRGILEVNTSITDVEAVKSTQNPSPSMSEVTVRNLTALNLQAKNTADSNEIAVSPSGILSKTSPCNFEPARLPPCRGGQRIPGVPAKFFTNVPNYPSKPPSPRHLRPKKLLYPKADPASIVQVGFRPFASQPAYAVLSEAKKFYPPLSNAAYGLTTDSPLNTTYPRMPDIDGLNFVKANIVTKKAFDAARDAAQKDPERPSIGERLAATINWDRVLYSGGEADHITSLTGSRKTYIEAIDAAITAGQVPFFFCNKCNNRHIPWGAPITIGDRDTCLSMLPEWFPVGNLERPWDVFIEFVNRCARIDDVLQGRLKDPEASNWDKEYHEDSREWRAVGRKGGWWKCRTIKEGVDVPPVEIYCELCHKRPKAEEKETVDGETKLRARREIARKWTDKHFTTGMEKDRKFIESTIRAQRD